jgi:hypothetical protein
MAPRQPSLPVPDAGVDGAGLPLAPSPEVVSEVFDASFGPRDLPDPPPDDPPPDDPPPDDPRRSSFAQPDPLNTIDGLETALRMEPSAPHAGQKRGPSAWMPWMTSVTRPQTEQP